MRPDVTYTPCAAYLREKTCDIITFAQFEEGNISTKTCNDAESFDDSNEELIMPPLRSEEDMDAMGSGDNSDHDLISTEILEEICDESETHPNHNRI